MPSWSEFKDLCTQRFGPPIRSNRLGTVAHLSFNLTVQNYHERFLELLCHAEHLLPSQMAELFTAGLPEHLRAGGGAARATGSPDNQAPGQSIRVPRAHAGNQLFHRSDQGTTTVSKAINTGTSTCQAGTDSRMAGGTAAAPQPFSELADRHKLL